MYYDPVGHFCVCFVLPCPLSPWCACLFDWVNEEQVSPDCRRNWSRSAYPDSLKQLVACTLCPLQLFHYLKMSTSVWFVKGKYCELFSNSQGTVRYFCWHISKAVAQPISIFGKLSQSSRAAIDGRSPLVFTIFSSCFGFIGVGIWKNWGSTHGSPRLGHNTWTSSKTECDFFPGFAFSGWQFWMSPLQKFPLRALLLPTSFSPFAQDSFSFRHRFYELTHQFADSNLPYLSRLGNVTELSQGGPGVSARGTCFKDLIVAYSPAVLFLPGSSHCSVYALAGANAFYFLSF